MRITPFSKPCYISVYRLLFCLIILRCLCVVTSWFAIITFPVSAYIDSLRARTSMLVDPQHQYIVFLKQFLKEVSTPENLSTSYRRDHPQQQKEVSTLAEGKFLFHFSPASMPTTLIQAPAFSDACAKRGFYTGKISYRTLHLCLHGNALPLSQKRDFRPAQFVAATGSIQKKI